MGVGLSVCRSREFCQTSMGSRHGRNQPHNIHLLKLCDPLMPPMSVQLQGNPQQHLCITKQTLLLGRYFRLHSPPWAQLASHIAPHCDAHSPHCVFLRSAYAPSRVDYLRLSTKLWKNPWGNLHNGACQSTNSKLVLQKVKGQTVQGQMAQEF